MSEDRDQSSAPLSGCWVHWSSWAVARGRVCIRPLQNNFTCRTNKLPWASSYNHLPQLLNSRAQWWNHPGLVTPACAIKFWRCCDCHWAPGSGQTPERAGTAHSCVSPPSLVSCWRKRRLLGLEYQLGSRHLVGSRPWDQANWVRKEWPHVMEGSTVQAEVRNWSPDKVSKAMSQSLGTSFQDGDRRLAQRENQQEEDHETASWMVSMLCSGCFLGLLFSSSPSALTKVIVSFHASLSQWWTFQSKQGSLNPEPHVVAGVTA